MAVDTLPYLRIKYKHLGRGWTEGDCLNLLLQFYQKEFSISLPDFTAYEEDWAKSNKNYFLKMYKTFNFRKFEGDVKFGDVIFFKNSNGIIIHLGIIIDANSGLFMHTTKIGTAIHSYYVGEWASKVGFIIRHKDIYR